MKIKKLQLHNFGVYAGDNEFVFEGKKPIVLIGGLNGRGKTTFLESVLLALYGARSFAFTESDQRAYSSYLRSFVNRESDDKTCSVTLEFEISEGTKEEYIIKRSWDANRKRPKEQVCVFKNGVYNEFLTDNWPLFIENILPSALSSYFFFNGEKIEELAIDDTNEQLKSSIRSMLGISILDVLSNDIVRNLKRINKKDKQNDPAEELLKLRDEKEKCKQELSDIDLKLVEANEHLKEDELSLESLHQLYLSKGGDAINKKELMIKKRSDLTAELSKIDETIYEYASEELPLLLVNDLIKDVKLQATDEHTSLIMQESVQQLDRIFTSFADQYSGNKNAGKDFINYVKQYTKDIQTETVYNLSDQGLYQINKLVEGILENESKETKTLLMKKKKLYKKIDEVDSFLALDIDDKEIHKIHEKIKKNENKLIDDKVKIAELEQRRSVINSKFINANAEFNKKVEIYLSTAEARDNAERIEKYSNIALNVIQQYRIELQKRKTDLLASTITECYLKLANKKTLIHSIAMDPETLDWKCLSEDNHEISKKKLSAGERQLLVISVLWALAICSKQKLPVIIDTPLSRLDSLHRTTMITTYFPNAGEQTIILSTDTEISKEYYQLIKDNVGDEFTLDYDEASKSTSIKKGYLIGEQK